MNLPEEFDAYLAQLPEPGAARLGEVLNWVAQSYPELVPVFKWKQPMFTDHGTFIIGFSAASAHFSVAPEVLPPFLDRVRAAGYSHGAKLFRIRYDEPVDYDLLAHIIDTNRREKATTQTFWRH